MDYKKYIIYWNRHDFYNYGSQVAFHHKSVSYKNELCNYENIIKTVYNVSKIIDKSLYMPSLYTLT